MKKLSLAVLSIVVLYFGFIVFLAFSKGYDIEHMDWNNDGTTTFFEMLDSEGIGFRNIDEKCGEYYSLKDGLEVKKVCK
ncbi:MULTISPECIES: hypothetical protein [Pseudoalteromonas]|nr:MULTISPECIES: hypothetical protein [Pseudoalteromonas]MBH0003705.1 hypothetical protein [Pseudoalteromonas sp. SWYJZ12]